MDGVVDRGVKRGKKGDNTGESFVNASILCKSSIRDISYFDKRRYIRLHAFKLCFCLTVSGREISTVGLSPCQQQTG